MTVSYFVRYQGLGEKLPDFTAHYREKHARILAEFPGLRGLVLHTPANWADPFPVEPDPTEFLAEMQFESTEALAAALRSEARERARADFANLPKAERVTHQAMTGLKVL
jgi:uncharacterized protein (TIGR02118 family)